jgi:hypothetical protein
LFAYYKVKNLNFLNITHMKKKLIIGSLCFGLVFVLSACGTENSQTTKTETDRFERRPDFGQPKTQPEVRGVVKSVIGNEVSVLKVDMPQRASSTDTTTASSTRRLSIGTTQDVPGGGMGMGMGGGRPGEDATTDRETLMAQVKAMSTGEEKVTIPVGIKMLKAGTDDSRSMVEANISDITADKMITIWLDASVTDKKVASFVLIN